MDTKKDSKIPKCGSFPENKEKQVIVGAKQLRKALKNGQAQRVFLAENADPAITEPLARMCEENSVPYTWVPSMADLGRACGIDVGAAAAATVA